MAGSFHLCGSTPALGRLAMLAACAVLVTACASTSYTQAAMTASDAGDQKTAASLARKEVARFAKPSECSPTTTTNCGTLALAYGTLAGYQIMDGDVTGGESSFRNARGALRLTDPANRASATAMVYRDVSEAYWRIGDQARAIDVFKEGRTAGADQYLYMSSAARAAEPPKPEPPPADQPPADEKAADRKVPDAKPPVPKLTNPKAADQKASVSR